MSPNNFLKDFESLHVPVPGVRLPKFIVEDKYKKEFKITKEMSNYEFLRFLTRLGYAEKIENVISGEKKDLRVYEKRIEYELGIIEELGFTDYILLIWDIIDFCKGKDIAVGPGRGSAAGSLVLYLIGVTKIDPLKYNLYFERFISKIRAKKQVIDGVTYIEGTLAPDVDLDFDFYRRNEVLDYINNKYSGRTCKILTLNTLSSKLLIKEVGKIFGSKTEEEMNLISSYIPKIHGQVKDLHEAYDEVIQLKEWCDNNKDIYDIALKLTDLNKNNGVHPSGILVSYEELEEKCPTQLTSEGELVSSYEMNQVLLSSLKVDILGLRAVSVIDDVCKDLKIKVEDIDINDKSIYDGLQNLMAPHGLFQIEASLAYETTKKVKPKNLEELAAIMALSRPGAMAFIDDYAGFSNFGTKKNLPAFFDDILGETGNICLFQEQLMRCLNKIGFTLDESEVARKIVGKKLIDKVKEWEKKIKDKVKENKLSDEIGEIIWKILNDSASYSFNKSHALSYAFLSALTCYLKFNHPQQFYLSLLKMTRNEPDPITEISKIQKEMECFNIKLLQPSLQFSSLNFSKEKQDIRFGLSSIKSISDKTLEKFNNFKREYSNKFELFESANEAGFNIGTTCALIMAGCLDDLSTNRPFLVYEAQLFNILSDREKRIVSQFGTKFNYKLTTILKALTYEIKDEKGKFYIKESRCNTIKKSAENYKAIYEQNTLHQSLARFWYERKFIGYSYSSKLIDIFRPHLQSLRSIYEISGELDKTRVEFVGIVTETPNILKSKNGNTYGKFFIADETGMIKTMIFKDKLNHCKESNGKLPEEDSIVIVKGQKMEGDVVFADSITLQDNKIFLSLADLKRSQKETSNKSS